MASPARSTLYWLAVSLIAVALVGAACSDDNGNSNTSTRAPSSTRSAPSDGVAVNAAGSASAAVRMALEQGIGSAARDGDIRPLDIDVLPDGTGLPEGSGNVSRGAEVYAARCAACHGVNGRNPSIGPLLISEPGPWKSGMPKTIGSYWPYATTVFDYIRRAMPLNEPGSLSADELYAVVAWLLNQNQIVPDNAEMNQDTLPDVEMPNRDSFTPCWPDECRPDLE